MEGKKNRIELGSQKYFLFSVKSTVRSKMCRLNSVMDYYSDIPVQAYLRDE